MTNVFPPPPVDVNGNPETIYPVSALAKFSGRMRQIGDGPFDPSWPVQGWSDPTADTSDPANVYVYNTLNVNKDGSPILDPQGRGSLKQITIPAARAAKVNLPGVPTYASFPVPITSATRGGQPINPIYLATPAQAQSLLAQLNAAAGSTVCTGLVDQGLDGDPANPWMPFVYPAGDDRRQFIFFFKAPGANLNDVSSVQYVGLLLLAQNAMGVGSPGHWDVSGNAPLWVSTPAPAGPSQWSAGQSQPVPLRSLIAGETIQGGMFGVFVTRSLS